MSIPVVNTDLAVKEAQAAIEGLLVEIGHKHGVAFQWQVQFPPVVNALMQQAGVVQIQLPSIELVCAPLIPPSNGNVHHKPESTSD